MMNLTLSQQFANYVISLFFIGVSVVVVFLFVAAFVRWIRKQHKEWFDG